jgi:hypothetical protein
MYVGDSIGISVICFFNTCLFGLNNLTLKNIKQKKLIEEHTLYY